MRDPDDRQRRRRVRRGPTLGPIKVSWRWEVGLPLVLIGVGIAALTIGIEGGGVLFWIGAGIAGAGAAIMLQQ